MIKTVSLPNAKALKEAGFRQDTYFLWGQRKNPLALEIEKDGYFIPDIFFTVSNESGLKKLCADPTTDELLEELPSMIVYNNYATTLKIIKNPTSYSVTYQSSKQDAHICLYQELSECLARMWLWLNREALLGKKG